MHLLKARLFRTTLAAILLAAGALGTVACAAEKEDFGKLTVDEVQKKLGEKSFYVFDNNPLDDFKEGHVPGAKWVKYNAVKAEDLPKDKEATLVFYCANEH